MSAKNDMSWPSMSDSLATATLFIELKKEIHKVNLASIARAKTQTELHESLFGVLKDMTKRLDALEAVVANDVLGETEANQCDE